MDLHSISLLFRISFPSLAALSEANQHSLPFYWRPVSRNFTSLDAIICTSTKILLIQSTVSSKHGINVNGLKNIRDNIPSQFWKDRQCHLIFITPGEDGAVRLSSRTHAALKDFADVEIYSGIFPIGTSTFTSSQLNELRRVSVRKSSHFIVLLLIGYCRCPQMKMVGMILKM